MLTNSADGNESRVIRYTRDELQIIRQSPLVPAMLPQLIPAIQMFEAAVSAAAHGPNGPQSARQRIPSTTATGRAAIIISDTGTDPDAVYRPLNPYDFATSKGVPPAGFQSRCLLGGTFVGMTRRVGGAAPPKSSAVVVSGGKAGLKQQGSNTQAMRTADMKFMPAYAVKSSGLEGKGREPRERKTSGSDGVGVRGSSWRDRERLRQNSHGPSSRDTNRDGQRGDGNDGGWDAPRRPDQRLDFMLQPIQDPHRNRNNQRRSESDKNAGAEGIDLDAYFAMKAKRQKEAEEKAKKEREAQQGKSRFFAPGPAVATTGDPFSPREAEADDELNKFDSFFKTDSPVDGGTRASPLESSRASRLSNVLVPPSTAASHYPPSSAGHSIVNKLSAGQPPQHQPRGQQNVMGMPFQQREYNGQSGAPPAAHAPAAGGISLGGGMSAFQKLMIPKGPTPQPSAGVPAMMNLMTASQDPASMLFGHQQQQVGQRDVRFRKQQQQQQEQGFPPQMLQQQSMPPHHQHVAQQQHQQPQYPGAMNPLQQKQHDMMNLLMQQARLKEMLGQQGYADSLSSTSSTGTDEEVRASPKKTRRVAAFKDAPTSVMKAMHKQKKEKGAYRTPTPPLPGAPLSQPFTELKLGS